MLYSYNLGSYWIHSLNNYWLHEVVTWEIVNVNLGSVEVGFLGVTISHVTHSCSQYMYFEWTFRT